MQGGAGGYHLSGACACQDTVTFAVGADIPSVRRCTDAASDGLNFISRCIHKILNMSQGVSGCHGV